MKFLLFNLSFNKNFRPTITHLLILAIFIIIIGLYIGNVLFGTTSLTTLNTLDKREKYLKKEISLLKKENALYMKKYLDLKAVEPE
jgi:uncharacterized protein YoxC